MSRRWGAVTLDAMNTTTARIALVASLLGCAFWAAKSVTIAVAGLGKSPLEDPLFFAGYLALLVAAGALGIRYLAHKPSQRPLAAVAGLVLSVVVAMFAGWVVDLVQPAHAPWVWGELDLWAVGVTTMLVAAYTPGRRHEASDLRSA